MATPRELEEITFIDFKVISFVVSKEVSISLERYFLSNKKSNKLFARVNRFKLELDEYLKVY